MIPYEELCAALERYSQGNVAREGEAPGTSTMDADLPPMDARTNETQMPPVDVQPIYDDRSNELDIGDVLSDEEAPKN